MSILRQILVTALILGAAAAAWFGLIQTSDPSAGSATQGRGAAGMAQLVVPVVTEAVMPAVSLETVRTVGTGDARRSVVVYPSTSGEVVEVMFAAGDRVAAGDPLVALDAEAEMLATELARIRVTEAEATLARYERLAPTRSIPESELDAARTALDAARTGLASAELALRRRTVRAPFDGVMGLPEVDVGDVVSTTVPLGTIDDRSAILVEFAVPERYAAFVTTGLAIRATTPSVPGARFEGTVTAIDSRIDPATRTLTVRAEIPNDEDRLRPGMSFAVALSFEGGHYPSVPEMAIQWDRNGSYVWRIVEGTAERVPVTIVQRSGGRVLVEGDLTEADRVVVEGVQRVRAGGPVDDAAAPQREAGPEPGVAEAAS